MRDVEKKGEKRENKRMDSLGAAGDRAARDRGLVLIVCAFSRAKNKEAAEYAWIAHKAATKD